MGKEPANISHTDATHNDLHAIGIDMSLPDNMHGMMTKGNTTIIEKVFDAYAMEQFSPEKQKEVLKGWEEVQRLSMQSNQRVKVLELTSAETITVQWLLACIRVPFDAPSEGFKESSTSLLFRMRTAGAEHQTQWEQEQKTIEDRYRVIRRG